MTKKQKQISNEVTAVLDRMRIEADKHGLRFETEEDVWKAFPNEESYLRGLLYAVKVLVGELEYDMLEIDVIHSVSNMCSATFKGEVEGFEGFDWSADYKPE